MDWRGLEAVFQPFVSDYSSCIRVDGLPILAPIISESMREEMRQYKALAIAKESRIRTKREELAQKLHTEDDELSVLDNGSASLGLSTEIGHYLPAMGTLSISTPSTLVAGHGLRLGVPEEMDDYETPRDDVDTDVALLTDFSLASAPDQDSHPIDAGDPGLDPTDPDVDSHDPCCASLLGDSESGMIFGIPENLSKMNGGSDLRPDNHVIGTSSTNNCCEEVMRGSGCMSTLIENGGFSKVPPDCCSRSPVVAIGNGSEILVHRAKAAINRSDSFTLDEPSDVLLNSVIKDSRMNGESSDYLVSSNRSNSVNYSNNHFNGTENANLDGDMGSVDCNYDFDNDNQMNQSWPNQKDHQADQFSSPTKAATEGDSMVISENLLQTIRNVGAANSEGNVEPEFVRERLVECENIKYTLATYHSLQKEALRLKQEREFGTLDAQINELQNLLQSQVTKFNHESNRNYLPTNNHHGVAENFIANDCGGGKGADKWAVFLDKNDHYPIHPRSSPTTVYTCPASTASPHFLSRNLGSRSLEYAPAAEQSPTVDQIPSDVISPLLLYSSLGDEHSPKTFPPKSPSLLHRCSWSSISSPTRKTGAFLSRAAVSAGGSVALANGRVTRDHHVINDVIPETLANGQISTNGVDIEISNYRQSPRANWSVEPDSSDAQIKTNGSLQTNVCCLPPGTADGISSVDINNSAQFVLSGCSHAHVSSHSYFHGAQSSILENTSQIASPKRSSISGQSPPQPSRPSCTYNVTLLDKAKPMSPRPVLSSSRNRHIREHCCLYSSSGSPVASDTVNRAYRHMVPHTDVCGGKCLDDDFVGEALMTSPYGGRRRSSGGLMDHMRSPMSKLRTASLPPCQKPIPRDLRLMLGGFVKGHLTRRLITCERSKKLITTIRDVTAELSKSLSVCVDLESEEYLNRLASQIQTAKNDFYAIFFDMPTAKQMELIARQREIERLELLKRVSDKPSMKRLSAATIRALERKQQRMNGNGRLGAIRKKSTDRVSGNSRLSPRRGKASSGGGRRLWATSGSIGRHPLTVPSSGPTGKRHSSVSKENRQRSNSTAMESGKMITSLDSADRRSRTLKKQVQNPRLSFDSKPRGSKESIGAQPVSSRTLPAGTRPWR